MNRNSAVKLTRLRSLSFFFCLQMSSTITFQSKSKSGTSGPLTRSSTLAASLQNQADRRVMPTRSAKLKRPLEVDADVDQHQDDAHRKKRAAVSKSTAKKANSTAAAKSRRSTKKQNSVESNQASSIPAPAPKVCSSFIDHH